MRVPSALTLLLPLPIVPVPEVPVLRLFMVPVPVPVVPMLRLSVAPVPVPVPVVPEPVEPMPVPCVVPGLRSMGVAVPAVLGGWVLPEGEVPEVCATAMPPASAMQAAATLASL